jgi:hypothetical protein
MPLLAGKQRGVALHQDFGALDAGRSDAGGGIALETLPKGAVLAAVEGQHRRIKRDAGKRTIDHTTRDTLALGVARHAGEEAVEVAAAWRITGQNRGIWSLWGMGAPPPLPCRLRFL